MFNRIIQIIIKDRETPYKLYLVTNDLTMNADRLYDVYKRRWRIEEFHTSVKQNTSFAKSPAKVARTQRNHIIASCKLAFLKIKTALNHFALKYKLLVRANGNQAKSTTTIDKVTLSIFFPVFIRW